MTKNQRIALQADWWPAACREQGWKSSDRELRLLVCSWAVSLPNPTALDILTAVRSDEQPSRLLISTNDLNDRDDVDKVKAVLKMLSSNLALTGEVGQPEIGSARRKRDMIRGHLKCLALYEEQPRRFLAALVNDMFNRNRRTETLTIRDLDDTPRFYLDRKLGREKEGPSQLDRLVMRMATVVNQKRNENVLASVYKHLQRPEAFTIHEMKVTAGVRCECAICRQLKLNPLIPALEDNWSDFDPELDPSLSADSELGSVMVNSFEGDPF